MSPDASTRAVRLRRGDDAQDQGFVATEAQHRWRWWRMGCLLWMHIRPSIHPTIDPSIHPSIHHHPSFIIHHSPFIIRHSPFTIHHSSFIIHHSSFVIHHSSSIIRPSIIHHPSCIIHHLSFIIHHSSFIIHPAASIYSSIYEYLYMEYGNSQIQHDPIIVAFATAHWL